jgi:hypothetical protein
VKNQGDKDDCEPGAEIYHERECELEVEIGTSRNEYGVG